VRADRIVVLDQGGHLAQEGTYEELLAREGLFRELARRQLVSAS
jgi:ABC-type multidrug transport system fused ATPase/permease subunit